jgi:hypothetical protein
MINVIYCHELRRCPVEVVNGALELNLELRKRTPHVFGFLTGEERALWAEINGDFAGVFLWNILDNGGRWWVDFCGVKPQYQRLGVYRALRGRFRQIFDGDPIVTAFESHVAYDNERMRKLNEVAGSKPVFVRYRFDKG